MFDVFNRPVSTRQQQTNMKEANVGPLQSNFQYASFSSNFHIEISFVRNPLGSVGGVASLRHVSSPN